MASLTSTSIKYAGFIDYSSVFAVPHATWIIVGSVIVVGTVISVLPQIASIIINKSSFGLNPMTLFITTFSQFVLLTNVICFHIEDFMGFLQYPFYQSIPRFLPFLITFALWFCFLVIPFLHLIFFDKELREARPAKQIKREKLMSLVIIILFPSLDFIFLIVYFVIGAVTGFNSSITLNYGKVCGTIATIIGFAQYIPQMVTTIRLKDPGSLSLILLLIQAPGGTANALFMAIAQHDDWTTWISILSASIQQFILIIICVYYKAKKGTLFSICHKQISTNEEKSMRSVHLKEHLNPEKDDLE